MASFAQSVAAILPSQFPATTTSLQKCVLKPLQYHDGVHFQPAVRGAGFQGVRVHSCESGLCPSAISVLLWRPGSSIMSEAAPGSMPAKLQLFTVLFPGKGYGWALPCHLAGAGIVPAGPGKVLTESWARLPRALLHALLEMGFTVHTSLSPALMFLCSSTELAPTQDLVFLQGLVTSRSAFEAAAGRTTPAALSPA